MSHHLAFDKYEIDSLSEPGKKTLEILRLNNQESIRYRKLMQGLIVQFLQYLGQVDIKDKREQIEESLVYLAQLIGEEIDTVKSALKIS